MEEEQSHDDGAAVVGGRSHAVWNEALGKVAFWFGQLEWSSYWVIDSFGIDGLTPQIAEQPFSTRTRTAKNLMAAHLAGRQLDDLAEQWRAFFDAIITAARERNAVLHSPLVVGVSRMPDGKLSMELVLAHMRNRDLFPHVELQQVQELALTLGKV